MKDFFKDQLKVGDVVGFIETNYRNFRGGVVRGFTPQKVRIDYFTRHGAGAEQTLRFPSEVIRSPHNL